MDSAADARSVSGNRLISPANAALTACFLAGFGASEYLLEANHVSEAAVGFDSMGTAKSVLYATLGLTAGAFVSAWARLRADIRGSLPLYFLFMAFVCIASEPGAAWAREFARLGAGFLGHGSLAVSFLEHLVALWLGFPYFFLLGLAVHRIAKTGFAQTTERGEAELRLPLSVSLGAAAGGLVYWLAPVPSGFHGVAAMIVHLAAAAACLFCMGEDSAVCKGKTGSEPKRSDPKPLVHCFAVGFLSTLLVVILYWILRLVLGPLDAAPGIFLAALAGGLGCGLWLAGGREGDSGSIVSAAPFALLAAAILAAALVFEPILGLRAATLQWIDFRGHEFHAPFFRIFVAASALLLVFPSAAALGIVLVRQTAGREMAEATQQGSAVLPALIGGGATVGAVLAGNSFPAILGVKPALFAAAAVSVWIHCFAVLGGLHGIAAFMRRRFYAVCLASIALFAALVPLHGIAYSIVAGAGGTGALIVLLAAVAQGSKTDGLMHTVRRRLPGALCLALGLLAAFAGPANQARYIIGPTAFAKSPLSGGSDSVFFGSQGIRENVQIISVGTRIPLQLFVNGLEREYAQRFGAPHDSAEPPVFTGVLPSVYVRNPERLALTGINLGTTARTLLSINGSSQLDLIVRNAEMITALRHVFGYIPPQTMVRRETAAADLAFLEEDSGLNPIFANPRAFFSVLAPQTYDAVVSVAGELADPADSPGFSVAHYRRISAALKEGGVFVQHFRTKYISEGQLSSAMNMISESFGEYALYSIDGDLIVVAAKHGSSLPAPSGTALQENAGSLPVRMGFRDLQHVYAHLLGSDAVFEKFFRSASRSSPEHSFSQAVGNLLDNEKLDLADSLFELDFSLSSVLDGNEHPELEIAADRLRFTWEGLRYAYALSLYEHVINGRWEAVRFKRRDLSRIRRILESADCPADEGKWLDLMTDLRIATRLLNPYLSRNRMQRLWDRIDEGCLGSVPVEGIATVVDYYRSIGRRDFEGVLRNGSVILGSGGIETSSGADMLASMLIAHLAAGDRIGAMELFTRYAPFVDLSDSTVIRLIGSLVFEDDRQESSANAWDGREDA